MTIKQRIVGKSLATALLVAAVGLLSAASMLRIGSTLRTAVVTELRESIDADHLQGAAENIDKVAQQYVTAVREHRQPEAMRLKGEVNAAFDQVAHTRAELDQTLRAQSVDAAQSSPNSEDARQDQHQMQLFEQESRSACNEWSELQSHVNNNGSAETDSALLDHLTLTTGAFLKDSQNFESRAKADMLSGLNTAQDRVATSVRVLITAAVCAVILSLGLGILVAMPLVARLARLRDGAARIGDGNLEARINVGTGDEIGQLGTAFNEMAAKLRSSRDELQENESRFRELAEAIREVFWISAPDASKLYYISPAYEEVWGRSLESAYRNPVSFAEAIIAEDRPRILEALKKMSTDGMDTEYRLLRPDGQMRWIHSRGFAVRDETGQVQRVVGIATDVTKQKMAEDALRGAQEDLEQRVKERTSELQEANEALRRKETELQHANDAAEAASRAKSVVFDTALDAIVTMDSHGLITEWNLQAETMFRWDRTEVIGLRLDQTIIPEPLWAEHRREIEEFVKKGEGPLLSKLVELMATRRDGKEFPAELAITPALSGGECTFTAFIRDITVRKQAEADLRKARDAADTANLAKSEFLASMSHEIRTPLNGVIGMSDLLLDTKLDEKQQRFAQLIKSSGESLSQLINDILDFAKIEARKLEIENVDFDLNATVEDVNEMMAHKAAQKGLDLACLTMPDVPRYVTGDSGRVKQILVNLINNAIKFTESGSVSTRLALEGRTEDHVTVRFSITDTGIGVPADRMDRLFKSFSQVDASTTRTYGGTGLGLAISKQLAELMGGSIGVESTVGRGSTFWFTLRLGTAQTPAPTSTGAANTPRGLRILAAHSSPTMREILRTQLSGWGLEAATASTGEEAMKMLLDAKEAGRPYDVAILDGELPDIDTHELGKAIKAHFEITKTVLLILLPVNSDPEPSKLKMAGFSGHLIKPVRQSRLYDAIVNAMVLPSQPQKLVAKPMPIASGSASRRVDAAPQARILVAEDNRVNQIVASEVLTKHGYACEIVENGKKAVAAALSGGYDLILMDCSMPEMDGFEATRKIRQEEAEAAPAKAPRHTPIIALTANAISGDRERCLEAGMDDYVSKPIDPNLLIKTIQSLLAKSWHAPPIQHVVERPATQVAAPAPITDEQMPPIAIDALLDRCMGDAGTVALIIDEFERQAVENVQEITRHMGSGNGQETARVAHALKGASAILSAAKLTDIAFKLERMGRTGAPTGADKLLTELTEEVKRCIDYLPVARGTIAKKIKV